MKMKVDESHPKIPLQHSSVKEESCCVGVMKFCPALTEILIKFRVAYHLLEFFKHLLVIVVFLFLFAHDGWLHCFCLYVRCRLSINTLYASIFLLSLVVAVDTELGQPNVCCE